MGMHRAGMWVGIVLEAPDPASLARFYSALLGWPVGFEQGGTSILDGPGRGETFAVFQAAEGYVAPVWPPVTGQQRPMMHLDIQVDDLDEAVEEATSLGATLAEFQPHGHARVMYDPAGHPFCLCRETD